MWGGSDSSAEAEPLILVDEADREVGYLSKERCHEGRGVLHRAFSLLIFNDRGELLLQRRAAAKRLWPHYWSNSCCSHPRRTESMETAIHRRLHEELGLACPLRFLFKFQYQAQFDNVGAEHELCSVFIGPQHRPGARRPQRDRGLALGEPGGAAWRRCRARRQSASRPGSRWSGSGSGGITVRRFMRYSRRLRSGALQPRQR